MRSALDSQKNKNQKEQTMKIETFDPEEHKVVDLRRKLSGKKFKKGENVAYTDKVGNKLLVKVKSGQIIAWRAINNQGEEIQSLHVRNPHKSTPKRMRRRCYVCSAGGDGGYTCYRVSC